MKLKENLRTLEEYFKTREEILFAYLFGSRAQGKENPMSDTDIAIFTDAKIKNEPSSYGYKAEVLTDLIQLLKTNAVDLVILNNAPYFLRHRVVDRGMPIFTRDKKKRIHFVADCYSRYPDIKRLIAARFSKS